MQDVIIQPRTPRRISDSFNVHTVAQRLRHFAYAEMRLMEAQAGWLAFIPPAELKIELSYQLYEDACHVEALRNRLPELGAFDQRFEPPHELFVRFCNELTNTEDTIERLVGLAWVLRPHLAAVYRAQLERDDSVGNHPTLRILERAAADHEAFAAWGDGLLRQLIETDEEQQRAISWRNHLMAMLANAGCAAGELPAGTVHPAPIVRDDGPGKRLRKEHPVRDSRFRVRAYVRREGRAATDVWDQESLLKYMFMNVEGEIEATEGCGRTLYDFPDAPWELRFLIARQLWDEARHAEASLQRYAEMGGRLDLLPVSDLFPLYWGPVKNTDLGRRLVHLNQVIEGWVTDDFAMMVDICRGLGDERSAHLFEYLIADEWLHIKIGADWIPKLTANDQAYRAEIMAYRTETEREHFGSLDKAAVDALEQRTGNLAAR